MSGTSTSAVLMYGKPVAAEIEARVAAEIPSFSHTDRPGGQYARGTCSATYKLSHRASRQGGVGPVTVAALMENLLRTAKFDTN